MNTQTPAKQWEIVVGFLDANNRPYFAYLEHRGRTTWKSKRIAQKHCDEYTAENDEIAWVQEVQD